MRTYKTEAVIIRRRDYKESDRMLTVFTRDYGKLKILAKGVRKINSRRGPNIEFFNRVQISLYNGKLLDSLTEVKTVNAFPNLKKSLSTIGKAWEICELVDLLTREKQENREVYELMIDYLSRLDFFPEKVVMNDFKFSLLRILGFVSKHQNYNGELDDYIESLVERKLRTKRIYE